MSRFSNPAIVNIKKDINVDNLLKKMYPQL